MVKRLNATDLRVLADKLDEMTNAEIDLDILQIKVGNYILNVKKVGNSYYMVGLNHSIFGRLI